MQICPFLALGTLFAIYPFKKGFRVQGNILSKKETFNRELKKLLHPRECKCEEDPCTCNFSAVDKRRKDFVLFLEKEGIPFKSITMHSWRKGSASYTASGSTQAPPIIAICLRANWKLPGALNRYLFLEQAGDQFVGRVCAGLPMMDPKFCTLPPRFKKNLSEEDEALIEKSYRSIFKNDSLWGPNMVAICRNLFSTLCYHKDFLSSLPDTHM